VLSSATYPTDATQLDALTQVLERRVEDNRVSPLAAMSSGEHPFAELIETLLERAEPQSPEMPVQIARFLMDDLARRPRDRGLLFVSPGRAMMPAVVEGLERLAAAESRTELVLVAARGDEPVGDDTVTWVAPTAAGTDRPFLLYYGDGPAYAMLTAHKQSAEGLGFFHTSDRVLVEHLVFQLQRDLGIPVTA
jgi:hypothetical protein